MSSEHPAPEAGAQQPPAEPAARRRTSVRTPVAFVLVAVLAAAAGFVVSGSLRGGTAGAAPSGQAVSQDTGAAGAAVAEPVAAEYGEARGAADARQEQALVDADWVAAHAQDPDVVIIEVSENRPTSQLTRYDAGHVPGAVELVWYRDFVERLNRDLVGPEQLTEVAQSIGVDEDSTVVLYGDANNWFAAYGAWVFKLYGHPDVRLLDGGRNKWEADGRELSTTAPAPTRGTWEAKAPNRDIRAFQPEVLAVVDQEVPGAVVDIRGPAEYKGEVGVAEGFGGEAAAKWGHVPGAVNVPWGSVVNEDGTFKSVEEIRAVYQAVGVDGSEPVVVYCRIGERASHTWFALNQLLGYDVQLYDGSWTEWGNSVGVPVANPTLEASGGFSGLWNETA